ncbi:hypothetical protein U1Q18_024536 [Sarracenia purpurea var. burkii]
MMKTTKTDGSHALPSLKKFKSRSSGIDISGEKFFGEASEEAKCIIFSFRSNKSYRKQARSDRHVDKKKLPTNDQHRKTSGGMNPQQAPNPKSEPDRPVPAPTLSAVSVHPSSPSRFTLSATSTPIAGAQRRIAIAVDLSDESAFAVKWAVQNYLRPGDAVILLHVRPTSVLYGADWGAIDVSVDNNSSSFSSSKESQQKLENDFDNFTSTKAADLARPLAEAQIPFKIHIVKDHDMKERLCLEVERLGLSAVIMGSRGFGASRRTSKARLGSVSDYCVHHCICPVVVVRYPDDKDNGVGGARADAAVGGGSVKKVIGEEVELHPVPEEEQEYHDADDEH